MYLLAICYILSILIQFSNRLRTGGVQGSEGSCDYLLLDDVAQLERTHSLALTKLEDTHTQ